MATLGGSKGLTGHPSLRREEVRAKTEGHWWPSNLALSCRQRSCYLRLAPSAISFFEFLLLKYSSCFWHSACSLAAAPPFGERPAPDSPAPHTNSRTSMTVHQDPNIFTSAAAGLAQLINSYLMLCAIPGGNLPTWAQGPQAQQEQGTPHSRVAPSRDTQGPPCGPHSGQRDPISFQTTSPCSYSPFFLCTKPCPPSQRTTFSTLCASERAITITKSPCCAQCAPW